MTTPAAKVPDAMDASRERQASRGIGLAGALEALAKAVGRAPFPGAKAAALRVTKVAQRAAQQSTLLKERGKVHTARKDQAETRSLHPEQAREDQAQKPPSDIDPRTGLKQVVVWDGKVSGRAKTSKQWRRLQVTAKRRKTLEKEAEHKIRVNPKHDFENVGSPRVKQTVILPDGKRSGPRPKPDAAPTPQVPAKKNEVMKSLANLMGTSKKEVPDTPPEEPEVNNTPATPPGPAVWVPAGAEPTAGEPIGTQPGAEVRIAITGSADISEAMRKRISSVLDEIAERANGPLRLIIGKDKRTDREAEIWANAQNVPFTPFAPDWDNDRRGAGYRSSEAMLLDGNPNLVLSFPTDDENRWTRHMTMTAVATEIPVEVVGYLGGTYRLGPVSSENYEPPRSMDDLEDTRVADQILDDWRSEYQTPATGVIETEAARIETTQDQETARAKRAVLQNLLGPQKTPADTPSEDEVNTQRTGVAADHDESDDKNRTPGRPD